MSDDLLATLLRIQLEAKDGHRKLQSGEAINGSHALKVIESEAKDALFRAAHPERYVND